LLRPRPPQTSMRPVVAILLLRQRVPFEVRELPVPPPFRGQGVLTNSRAAALEPRAP